MKETEISLREAKEHQNKVYLASMREPQSPVYGVSEGVEALNNANRKIILSMRASYGSVYLGNVNPGIGTKTVGLRKYEGQELFNFCCEFCVPAYDEILDKKIREWNETQDRTCLNRIYQRIEKLHGVILVWS